MRDEYEVLGLLVDADAAADESLTFTMGYAGFNRRYIAGHPGWNDEWLVPSEQEIDELEARGWVRVTKRIGKERQFVVTGPGRREADRAAKSMNFQTGPSVDLTWESARGVLGLIFRSYIDQGAPDIGIRTQDAIAHASDQASAAAVVRELIRDDYLEATIDQDQDVPLFVRPTTKTLRLEASWPGDSAEAAVADLVAALGSRIETLPESEERSALIKVRDGVLGAAREFAIAFFAQKLQ